MTIDAKETPAQSIQERLLNDVDYLVVYMDWVQEGNHSCLLAMGLDSEGRRRLIGMTYGTPRSVRTVQSLLDDLIRRKLPVDRRRLYVVAGSLILRNSVLGMFGDAALIQRCRNHCRRDVTQPLPEQLAESVKTRLKDAFELPWQPARTRIELLASDIRDENPIIAANLLESLNEDLTINRLDLPPVLSQDLETTQILLQPQEGFEERVKAALTGVEDEGAALDRLAELYLEAEEGLDRVAGFGDMWILDTALKQEVIDESYSDSMDMTGKPVTYKGHRAHKRFSVRQMEGHIQCTIRAVVIDISLKGCAVETHSPLTVGRNYSFHINNHEGLVDLGGRIAWCKLNRTQRQENGEVAAVYQAGIEFEGTLSDKGDRLMNFLEGSVEILLDRRIFGRFKVEDKSQTIQLNSSFPFVVKKLSASGLLIETEMRPAPNSILPLEIKLGTETFEAIGKVAHAGENGDAGEVGIEFVECEPESHALLERFIAEELDSPLSRN